MQSGDLMEDVCAYGCRHFRAARRGGGEIRFDGPEGTTGKVLERQHGTVVERNSSLCGDLPNVGSVQRVQMKDGAELQMFE